MSKKCSSTFQQHIRNLYNDEVSSDFVIKDDSGKKIFLNQCIVKMIPYFRRFLETELNHDKSEFVVPSIKSLGPILKKLYQTPDNDILKELERYTVNELIDFLSAVDYYCAIEICSFVEKAISKNMVRILSDDINHYDVVLSISSSIFIKSKKIHGRIFDEMLEYITDNISVISKDVVDTDIFHKLKEEVQFEIVMNHKCYDLIDRYVGIMNSQDFHKFSGVFGDLCSFEQYSYLYGSWTNLHIKSVYPEFVLVTSECVGSFTRGNRDRTISITLFTSSLSVGDSIAIEPCTHFYRIKKITHRSVDVDTMYPNLTSEVAIDLGGICEIPDFSGEIVPSGGIKDINSLILYKIRKISNKYTPVNPLKYLTDESE